MKSHRKRQRSIVRDAENGVHNSVRCSCVQFLRNGLLTGGFFKCIKFYSRDNVDFCRSFLIVRTFRALEDCADKTFGFPSFSLGIEPIETFLGLAAFYEASDDIFTTTAQQTLGGTF